MTKYKIFFYLLIQFCSISLYGQKESELEEKAFEYYNNGEKYEALKVFKELYLKYPKSKHFPLTFFNIANAYQELDSIDIAIEWYKKILDSNIKDNQEWNNFPDTHTNIKFKAAGRLGNIYYNSDSIELGLKYYLLALNKYCYFSSSGTSKKKSNINLKDYIADCYKKLNKPDDFVKILLPEAITPSPWNENPVAKYLAEFISSNYDKAKFIIDFDQALNNLVEEDEYFVLPFWNDQIKIELYMGMTSKADFIKEVKGCEFYIELTK